jgi:hypothetical protein
MRRLIMSFSAPRFYAPDVKSAKIPQNWITSYLYVYYRFTKLQKGDVHMNKVTWTDLLAFTMVILTVVIVCLMACQCDFNEKVRRTI